MTRLVDLGNGFWNIRGDHRLFGLVNVGTQASLLRRDSGRFIVLDSCAMDTATRAAIRAYQRPEGLDSGVLSLAAARKLGLSVVDVPGAGPETVPVGAPAAE